MPDDKAPEPQLRQPSETYEGPGIGGQTLIMEYKCPKGWEVAGSSTGNPKCVSMSPAKGSE
jgi:hypothetical protein